MGKIEDSVKKAFKEYRKRKKLKTLIFSLVDIADYSVRSSSHRSILDEAINEELKNNPMRDEGK